MRAPVCRLGVNGWPGRGWGDEGQPGQALGPARCGQLRDLSPHRVPDEHVLADAKLADHIQQVVG
jgi:hypothetical protein